MEGGLACCDSWGHKESDTTEQLNWTVLILLGYNFVWYYLTRLPKCMIFRMHLAPWVSDQELWMLFMTWLFRQVPYSQSYGFFSSYVQVWELDHKESWALKKWCFWTVVLEKTLESSLDCKEIQPVHPKGDQSWDFFGRTDAEAETPILWPLHVKSWLIGKDSDAGRDWGQEEKGTTEDEMAGWHHRLNGPEF